MCQVCQLNINDYKVPEQDDKREFIQLHQQYMIEAFGDIEVIADKLRQQVNSDEYDTIVGIGLSGALVIPRLANLLGKKWAIVRKDDGTHSGNPIEGQIGRSWLFVDDLVASGRSREKVKAAVRRVTDNYGFKTNYIGTYQYHYNRYQSGEWD